MRNLFFVVEMEPALAAFFFFTGIPAEWEYLKTAILKFDKILLQWFPAKCVAYFKFFFYSCAVGGTNEILPVLLEKEGRIAMIDKAAVIEVALYCCHRRCIHGMVMIGSGKEVELLLMARLALLCAHISMYGCMGAGFMYAAVHNYK